MHSRNQRIRSFLFLASLFGVLIFAACDSAWARAGGGGSYGGGSSGGGSGGGSGSGGGEIIWVLIQFCIHYPAVGIPVTLVVIGGLCYGGFSAREIQVTRTIRRGHRLQNERLQLEALSRIREHDPAFNEETFLARMSTAFQDVQQVWTSQDMQPARFFISDGVFQRFSLQIEMQKADGLRNVMEDVGVSHAEIVAVTTDKHFDTVHVEFRASAIDYTLNAKKKLIEGSKDATFFTEYWSFHRRPGAKTLSRPGAVEGNCPNCGSPLKIADRASCSACKSTVNSGEFDWVLAEITQAREWHVPESDEHIGGLTEFQQSDPGFSVQHIEDRVSVMFWRTIAAGFFGDPAYSRPVLSDKFAAKMKKKIDSRGDCRRYLKEAAVGKVEMIDIQPAGTGDTADDMDRLRVMIRWSGILVDHEKGKSPKHIREKDIHTHLYVLIRKKGVTTLADRTFSSAGCSQCGAPIAVSEEPDCTYCGAKLTDGHFDWMLNAVEPYTPQVAYRDIFGGGKNANALGASGSSQQFTGNPDWELSLAVLSRMMHADGHLDPKERAQLLKIGKQRGLSESQIKTVINTAGSSEAEIPIPTDTQQGRRYLEQLVQASLADGKVSSAEMKFLTDFGEKIAMMPADIKMLVAKERRREYQSAKQETRKSRKHR